MVNGIKPPPTYITPSVIELYKDATSSEVQNSTCHCPSTLTNLRDTTHITHKSSILLESSYWMGVERLKKSKGSSLEYSGKVFFFV